jgi:hypothetical protein
MRSLPILALLLATPAAAREAEAPRPAAAARGPAIEASTGVEFEEGDYGTVRKIRRSSVLNSVRLGAGRFQVAATVPYSRIEAPANVVAGGGLLGLPIIIDPTRPVVGRDRREGLGDVRVAASYQVPTRLVALTASGEVKLPTASRRLGTGKADYAVSAQALKTIGAVTPFIGVGYTLPGNPDGYSLRNRLSVTGGMAARLGAGTRGFISYSHADNVNAALPAEQQVATGVNTAVSDRLSLGAYGSAGLSKGSPDVGAGVQLSVRIR